MALLLFNPGYQARELTVNLLYIGIKSANLRDIWLLKDLGRVEKSITRVVAPSDCYFFKLTDVEYYS